jgi:hypothetical protein
LWNMLINRVDDPNGKASDVDYKKVVLYKIAGLIFGMMLHGLDDVVKPGWLHPMNKICGINWKANANTA